MKLGDPFPLLGLLVAMASGAVVTFVLGVVSKVYCIVFMYGWRIFG
jgi:hypothetical protein